MGKINAEKRNQQFLNILNIPKSREELMRETGLGKSTVNNVLSALGKAGLVCCVMVPGMESKYEKVQIR